MVNERLLIFPKWIFLGVVITSSLLMENLIPMIYIHESNPPFFYSAWNL